MGSRVIKVAIAGATGLVGATLVERLLAQKDIVPVPLMHLSGNAWRLSRRPIELRTCNVMDAATLPAALAGCTAVVNCARGPREVMLGGLQNLLTAAKAAGVTRFVHLSSVAVYGDPPPPDSTEEDAPTKPARGSYGETKLLQDQMVKRAADNGLPAVILCPPNISGPHSYFLLGLVNTLRQRAFVLADGSAPCNLVDVDNLAYAIELALRGAVTDGRRLFVTDAEPVTWSNVIAALEPLVRDIPMRTMPRAELARRWQAATAKPSVSLLGSLAHLFSEDVRKAMRRDPLWERLDTFARGLVSRLGVANEDRLRHALIGAVSVPKISGEAAINLALAAQQLRGVRHSCARAMHELGYRPLFTFRESMERFVRWNQQEQGYDTEFADLIPHLA